MQQKQCWWCKQTFPLSSFSKNRGMPDGHINKCKACEKIAHTAYYETNKQRLLEKQRVYWQRTRPERLAQLRTRYAENREHYLALCRQYHQENKAKCNAISRANYYRNRDERLIAGKEYRESPQGRAVTAKAHARERIVHAQKIKARTAISNAIRDGRLVKGSTCICGKPAREAHHHKGYDKQFWLDVQWLCRACHKAADKAQQGS